MLMNHLVKLVLVTLIMKLKDHVNRKDNIKSNVQNNRKKSKILIEINFYFIIIIIIFIHLIRI